MSFSNIKFNPTASKTVDTENAAGEVYSPNKMPPQKPIDFRKSNVRVFGKKLIPVVVDLANKNVYPDITD